MKVIRATHMGMCFGVRDALQVATSIADPSRVTIHGELVHNEIINGKLAAAGFHQSTERERSCDVETPIVLITAHGISDAERARLRAAGKSLVDTTCPLVQRVHDASQTLATEGRLVLVIGKREHVEVLGITEDLKSFVVIETPRDVRAYENQSLGVISQTTMPSSAVNEIIAEVQRQNPGSDIKFVDTVCHPTKRRQHAMLDLIARVDVVVVVGGRNSNNTRRLVELCDQHRTPAFHVQDGSELKRHWFAGHATVGLTAGTSTSDETIDDVHQMLEQLTNARNVRFESPE